MNRIRIFLSSRVKTAFSGLDKAFTLTELRQYLRKSLEEKLFLDERMLDVVTNESSFRGDFSKDSFDNCLQTMRSCHIIIVLYNQEAGWSAAGLPTNGICHEEYLVALSEFSGMTWALDLSSYFKLTPTGEEKTKNDAFISDYTRFSRHREEITLPATVDELKATVLKQIEGYILEAVQQSFDTRKAEVYGSSVYGATLDWSKLTYKERQDRMIKVLEPTFKTIPAFLDIIKAYHVIPDHMSVADARNLIGRPFIEEHELIGDAPETSGVIHFVALYGNATEIQVKNLVGYPNLTVIKGTFGLYLWEKNMQVQMFFLTRCINPQTIRTRLSQLVNWLSASGEQGRIVVRARARYSILTAINSAQEIEGQI